MLYWYDVISCHANITSCYTYMMSCHTTMTSCHANMTSCHVHSEYVPIEKCRFLSLGLKGRWTQNLAPGSKSPKNWLLGSRWVHRHPYCEVLRQKSEGNIFGSFWAAPHFSYFVCFYIRCHANMTKSLRSGLAAVANACECTAVTVWNPVAVPCHATMTKSWGSICRHDKILRALPTW